MEVPEELKPYFNTGSRATFYMPENLRMVIYKMVESHFIDRGHKKMFNSNPQNYIALADAVNETFKNDLEGEEIEPRIISELCKSSHWTKTGEAAEKGRNKDKNIFLALYCYLKAHTNVFTEDEITQQLGTGTVFSLVDSPKDYINGAQVIDADFKHHIRSLGNRFNQSEFYTAKQNALCQWYGIANGWDWVRKDYEHIESEVLKSFTVNRNSKICAIVSGPGGSGKSTFLRRLAWNVAQHDFSVLWIDNIDAFCQTSLAQIKSNYQCKYLLIIEDWTKVSAPAEFNFLNQSAAIENIRIIIGDRDTVGRSYLEYLYGDNIFQLRTGENKAIIDHVLTVHPLWQSISDYVLHKPESYNVSLYVILFCLSKFPSLDQGDDKDVVANFRSIVKSDIDRMYNIYKGLAIAFYYWSHIHKERGLLIQWESLLRIADFYNGDDTVSKRLIRFDPESIIGQILSGYISLIKFKYHPTFRNTSFFTFNHDLLVEGVSAYNPVHFPEFDESIRSEMQNLLSEKSVRNIRDDIFYTIIEGSDNTGRENVVINGKKFAKVWRLGDGKSTYEPDYIDAFPYEYCKEYKAPWNMGLDEVLALDNELNNLYLAADFDPLDKMHWRNVALWMTYYFNAQECNEILKTLIERGCASPYILKIPELLEKQRSIEEPDLDINT